MFVFHATGRIPPHAIDGPETWRGGIVQVFLNATVGQGGVDQNVGNAGHPDSFRVREHAHFEVPWHFQFSGMAR